jgi:hypothetical protein
VRILVATVSPRAKVLGYRDDFEKEELQRIDDYVRTHLEPGFG